MYVVHPYLNSGKIDLVFITEISIYLKSKINIKDKNGMLKKIAA